MHATLERNTATAWGAKSVIDALSEAFRVLSATEGRVGHRRVMAAWPAYQLEPIDVAEQKLAKNLHYGRNKVRFLPNPYQIQHMEDVLLGTARMPCWLNGAVKAYPEQRRYLTLCTMARARRISDRQLCRGMGWPLTTFQRKRDRAAEVIAKQLNARGVPVW